MSAIALRRWFEKPVGGSWGTNPGESERDALCIRGTDLVFDRLGIDAESAPLRGFTTEDVRRRSLVAGDIVVEKSGGGDTQPVGRIGLFRGSRLAVPTNFAARLRPRAHVEPRFACYQLASLYFAGRTMAAVKQTTGIQNLDLGELLANRAWLPPLAEQRAIADYLGAETTRIDALIAKKQQLIHLLEERFDADREQLLTRPQGETLTRSRSGFFDAVPERWHETALRHLDVEVQTGPFGSQLHAEEYVEDGWPVVNPANIRDGRIRRIGNMTISDTKRDELSRHVLRKGDIVFGRRGEMGRAGLVGETEAGWLCGTGSLRLRIVSQRLDPAYLAEKLQTHALRNYFMLMSVGSTMDNLNSEIVLAMPCLVPEFGQQRALVDALRRSRARFDALTAQLVRQVTLLAEHRQALITAAVTGGFTVPRAA